MIAALLAAVGPRADGADAVAKTDETTTLTIDPSGSERIELSSSAGAQIRVLKNGRIGWCGGSDPDPQALAEGALAAALDGERLTCFLPARAPLADVVTRDRTTEAASTADLRRTLRSLFQRIDGPGRAVEAWLERSSGSVAVGNSRGVRAEYRVTLAGIGARVRSADVPPIDLHVAAGILPDSLEIEQLIAEVERRIAVPVVDAAEAEVAPVVFRPRAVRALLRPVLAALTGDPGPKGGSLPLDRDRARFDERLTLIDDPSEPLRPGSRPIDDDGVAALRLPVIERGRVVARMLDLMAGSRRSSPSTGHGRRGILGAPRSSPTNIRLSPGDGGADPVASIPRGLVVEDLAWSGAPNAASGAFVLAAPWAYRVDAGDVVGRCENIVLAGNVFDLLRRVIAIGADARWVGSACLPSIAVDGVRVARAAP